MHSSAYDKMIVHVSGLLADVDPMLLILYIPYVLLFLLDGKIMLFISYLCLSHPIFEGLIARYLRLLVFYHFRLLPIAQSSLCDCLPCLVL